MIAILAIVGAAAAAIAMKIISSEIEAWLPRLSENLIERASKRLPSADQDRYREEWYAHLNECPGKLGKCLHAIGCLLSANRLARIRTGLAKNRSQISLIFELGLMRLHLRLIEKIKARADRLDGTIDDFRQQVSQEIGVLIGVDVDREYAMTETKLPDIWTIRFVFSDYLTSSARLAGLERKMRKVRREYASFKLGSSTPASRRPDPQSPFRPT